MVVLTPAFLAKPFDGILVINNLVVVLLFSIFVSGTYILNDIFDRNEDRLHPHKKNRPIANGSIKIPTATLISWFLIISTLFIVNLISKNVVNFFLLYLFFTLLYSKYFKYNFLVSSISISLFFIIRLLVGSVATEVDVSIYLYVYIFFTSLYIAFLKKQSILNTGSIANKYSQVLEKGDKKISILKLSSFTLFISNLSIFIWSINNIVLEIENNLFNLFFVFTLVLYYQTKYIF